MDFPTANSSTTGTTRSGAAPGLLAAGSPAKSRPPFPDVMSLIARHPEPEATRDAGSVGRDRRDDPRHAEERRLEASRPEGSRRTSQIEDDRRAAIDAAERRHGQADDVHASTPPVVVPAVASEPTAPMIGDGRTAAVQSPARTSGQDGDGPATGSRTTGEAPGASGSNATGQPQQAAQAGGRKQMAEPAKPDAPAKVKLDPTGGQAAGTKTSQVQTGASPAAQQVANSSANPAGLSSGTATRAQSSQSQPPQTQAIQGPAAQGQANQGQANQSHAAQAPHGHAPQSQTPAAQISAAQISAAQTQPASTANGGQPLFVGAESQQGQTVQTGGNNAGSQGGGQHGGHFAGQSGNGGQPTFQFGQASFGAPTPEAAAARAQFQQIMIARTARPAALASSGGTAGGATPNAAVLTPTSFQIMAGPGGPQSTVSAPMASQVAQATPGRSGATPGAAIDQVAVKLSAKAKDGGGRISIKLNPEELGRVDVKLEIGRDGLVRANVQVERAETLDLLQRDARALERVLQDAGLKTDQQSLQFSTSDGRGTRGQAFGRGEAPKPDQADATDADADAAVEGQPPSGGLADDGSLNLVA